MTKTKFDLDEHIRGFLTKAASNGRRFVRDHDIVLSIPHSESLDIHKVLRAVANQAANVCPHTIRLESEKQWGQIQEFVRSDVKEMVCVIADETNNFYPTLFFRSVADAMLVKLYVK